MSEFETSEERQQAAVELISQISGIHTQTGGMYPQNSQGVCAADGYAWPCRTARAILTYRAKFHTRYDAVMDAIYYVYDAEDLNSRTDQIGSLALRIADTWDTITSSPAGTKYLLSGMLLMVSLNQEQALKASEEIVHRVRRVIA